MFKSEINIFSLAVAITGATLARFSPDAGWTMLAAGLLLTITLFAFDRGEYRAAWQSIALSGTLAYCLVIALIGAVALAHTFAPQSIPWPLPFYWQPCAWIVLTLVLLTVDRVRADSRTPKSLFMDANPAPAQTSPPPPPPPKRQPKPVAVKPVELPPNAGKPATIYLNIMDAGIACLRAVQAEHLGRDFYRITEPTPADEKWEFGTGRVVRCQKRTLSSGKALVAVEEAPRANPA
jgi:hypothetical protein